MERRFKTDIMYVEKSLRKVEDVIKEAMDTSNLNVVYHYITYLLAHANDTRDACLRSDIDDIMKAHGLEPFKRVPASACNMPSDRSHDSDRQRVRLRRELASRDSFAEKAKDVVSKMASKNGETIHSLSRGHARTYLYYVDTDAFCRAMDDMVSQHGEDLDAYLGKTSCPDGVSFVCPFIGSVLKMLVINDSQLQLTDTLFAFEEAGYNPQTAKKELSIKLESDDLKLMLSHFESLLKKHLR